MMNRVNNAEIVFLLQFGRFKMSRIVLRSKEAIRTMIDSIRLENYNILHNQTPIKPCVKEESIQENNIRIENLQDALHFNNLPKDRENNIHKWLVMEKDSIDLYNEDDKKS